MGFAESIGLFARGFYRPLRTIYATWARTVVYITTSTEFQKRGYPHSHIVVKVRRRRHFLSRCLTTFQVDPELPIDHIDTIIKASLPLNDHQLEQKVRRFMTHGRNHLTRETSRCRKGNKCIYGFPHRITPSTWIDEDGRVHYKRLTEEDRWIAPHVPELIDELDCHIYVDVVFTVSVFTYLYKYLYKGPDRTLFHIGRSDNETVDEIKDYIEARYLSAHEAAWRILGFHITSKTPSVSCLPIHLPEQNVAKYTGSGTASTSTTSLLIRYFNRPSVPLFLNVKYCEYFKEYVLYKWQEGEPLQAHEFLEEPIVGCTRNKVVPRRVGAKVSRLKMVSPTAGELFYIRCLLARHAASSFADLRTIDGITHPSFHEAALALGLFNDENEGHFAMVDAIASFCTPSQLRFLFSRILLEGFPAAPLWNEFKLSLAQDFITSSRSQERGIDSTLLSLQTSLQDGGRTLGQFGLPDPKLRCPEVVSEEERYSHRAVELLADAHQSFLDMNVEQKRIFNDLIDCVNNYVASGTNDSPPFFIEGKPGRGKTFVVNAICCRLRGNGHIVLVVGSSALAATLYEGGRTAHNLFQIPVTEVFLSTPFLEQQLN